MDPLSSLARDAQCKLGRGCCASQTSSRAAVLSHSERYLHAAPPAVVPYFILYRRVSRIRTHLTSPHQHPTLCLPLLKFRRYDITRTLLLASIPSPFRVYLSSSSSLRFRPFSYRLPCPISPFFSSSCFCPPFGSCRWLVRLGLDKRQDAWTGWTMAVTVLCSIGRPHLTSCNHRTCIFASPRQHHLHHPLLYFPMSLEHTRFEYPMHRQSFVSLSRAFEVASA